MTGRPPVAPRAEKVPGSTRELRHPRMRLTVGTAAMTSVRIRPVADRACCAGVRGRAGRAPGSSGCSGVPTQPEAVRYDEERRERHGSAREERVEQTCGRYADGSDVVPERPHHVSLDGRQYGLGQPQRIDHIAEVVADDYDVPGPMATSVPAPIAKPRSALANAGPSLMPASACRGLRRGARNGNPRPGPRALVEIGRMRGAFLPVGAVGRVPRCGQARGRVVTDVRFRGRCHPRCR